MTWDSEEVAGYVYLGLGSPAQVNYLTPEVRWNLITGSGSNPYAALDRFGRQTTCLWEPFGAGSSSSSSGGTSDLVHLTYGYDRDSNRIWRQDEVARSLAQNFDELYGYDTAQRLTDMARGLLNGGHTGIDNVLISAHILKLKRQSLGW
jgi:hypothetical protein